MYQPPAFAIDDPSVVLDTLRQAAFGHLVTATPDHGMEATALPFLVDPPVDGGPMVVRAHLARANRHWRSIGEGVHALLIVATVDAYVSPRWYPSKAEDGRVVPTWNYELIHLRGTVRADDDPGWKLAMVRDLTDHHEARTVGPDEPAWAVSDAPDDFVERQLRAIVGVELTVDAVEAKRKLSQNRSEDDRNRVIAALAASPEPRARSTAEAMIGPTTPA